MKKYRKRLGRLLAAVLAIMLIMQVPTDYISLADGNNGRKEKGSTDWSEVTQAVKLGLDKVSWQASGETVELTGNGSILDLSGVPLNAEMTWGIGLKISGLDIYTMNPSDCISFEIPQPYWNVSDTEQPQPVTLWGKTMDSPDRRTEVTVGYAEVADHKVTVTLEAGIRDLTGADAQGTLELPVRWNQENLAEDAARVKLELQKGFPIEVVIPAAPDSKEKRTEGTDALDLKEDAISAPALEDQEVQNPKDTKGALEEAESSSRDTKESVPGDTLDTTGKQEQTEIKEETEIQEKGGKKEEAGEAANQGESTGFFGTIRRLFQKAAGFFGVGRTAGRGVEDSYFEGGTTTKHVFSGADVPEGFSTVKLTAVSRKEGYETGQADAYVRFAYDVYMDEDFLYVKSDEFMQMPGFPQQGDLSDDAYFDLAAQWLESQPKEDVPDLIYTYELGEKFAAFVVDKTDLYSKSDASLRIGSYQIENGKLTVEMNKRLYFMNNISLRFSFDAQADGAKIPPDKQEAVLDDEGKLVYQAFGTSSGGTGGSAAPKYKVEKEAPVNVTDNRIVYEITVNALDGKNLNGKTFQDIMPQSGNYKLKVKSFTEKGSSEPIANAVDGDGNISYTFDALNGSGDNAVASASFLLELELDDASYQKLINNGSMSQMFSNQAKLLEAGASEPLAVSDTVQTQMKLTFIGKKGKASNLAGNRYNWTIELNTSLPYLKDGFLVDTLCWSDHSYDVEKGLKITAVSADGASATVTAHPQLVSGTVEWNDLTVDTLRTLANGRTEPFYYIFDTADDNPFYVPDRGSSEKQQNAVLVIPYNSYANQKVTVAYDTVLNMNGLNSNEYVDKTAAYQPKVENNVNLLWDNLGGIGPGPVAQDAVTFGKTVATDLNAVSKRGISYNEKTHQVTWGIEVNRLGVDLTDVVLTDSMGTNKYDLDQFAINYYKYNSKTHSQEAAGTLEPLAGTPNPTDDFGYTLDRSTGTLKIYLGNLETKTDGSYPYYSLTCETVLKDTSILSNQSVSQTIGNRVSLDAYYKGTFYSKESDAVLKTPNTLIEKDAVGTYDYMTHELSWKVTVNPDKLEIRDAKVTDALESGFTYGELKKVEINGTADAAALERIKGSTADHTSSAGNPTVVWTLGTIQPEDTYTLYFTAIAGADWRQAHLTCMKDGNPDLNAVVVPNEVKLEGTVGGRTITNATDSASQAVEKQPVEKKGVMQYENGEPTGEIQWTVWVNRSQYNISGYYLEEELKDEADGDKIHELDPDSVSLKRYDGPGAGGTDQFTEVTDPSAVTALLDAGGHTLSMSNGFRYTFPTDAGGNYNTYVLKFSTWLTQAAEAGGASINNKVYMKSADNSYTEESNTDDGGFHGGFNFDRAAAASPRPKIGLWKISKNSINTETPNADHSLGLDAVFSLEGYQLLGSNISGNTVTLDTKEGKYDKERKVKAGDATFLNINPNDNIVYVLHEKSSHTGYQKESSDPFFLYFVKDTDQLNGKADADITIHYDGADYTGRFLKTEKGPDGKYNEGNLKKIVFTNIPNTNRFTFTKQQVERAAYNPKAGGTTPYENAEHVVFKVEPQGNLQGKINPFYTEPSNASGEITLENLDPGTYKLMEVKSNPGYVNGGTVQLKVTAAEDGTSYTFTFSSPSGGIQKDGETSLQDDLLRTDVSFTKYVAYQDVPVKIETQKEVEFYLEGRTEGYTASDANFSQTARSSVQGAVKFTGVPVGTYKIYEKSASVKGYQVGKEPDRAAVYDLTVSEKESSQVLGSQTTSAGNTVTYKKKQAAAELHPITGSSSFLADTAGVSNIPVKGTIKLQKTVSDAELTGLNGELAGAEFALYRKNADGTVDTSVPAYTQVSGTDGSVLFPQVEYGDYQLKELTAPEGYQKSDAGIDISRSSLNLAEPSGDSFNYELAPVENTIYKTDVQFQKMDVDGNPLSGIQFAIYRRNETDIRSDGTGMIVDAADNIASYKAYAPCAAAASGGAGTFALAGLPFGDYLLVENGSADLQQGFNNLAVWISVRNGTLTVKGNSNFTGSLDAVTTDGADWKTLTPDAGVYSIVNYKQYGFVNLHKYAAEKDSTGALNVTGQALAGVEFEIRKAGSPEVYLTLKTGADGKLQPVTEGEQKGAYQDAQSGSYKHLFPGDYTIQEKAAPEGFVTNTAAVPFTINAGTTGHEGTAWIILDGTGTAEHPFTGIVFYQKAGESEPGDCYAKNETARGSIKLEKTNADEAAPVPLSGAGFLVYAGTDTTALPVASLLEAGEPGTCLLSNKNPLDSQGAVLEAVENSMGLPYLYQDGESFRLLTGTYTVKEVRAPEGYQISAEPRQITIEKDIQTPIIWKDQPLVLQVQKTDRTGTTFLEGAEFSVTGIFAGQTGEETRGMETDPADSSISLLTGQLIVGNTYVLQETKAPAGYICPDAEVEIQVDAEGNVTVTGGEVSFAAVDSAHKNRILFKDEVVIITLKKVEQEDETKVVGGVTYELYDVTGGQPGTKVTAVTTSQEPGTQGTVRLERLVGGHSYQLKEISAPDIYQVSAEPVSFKIQENGTLAEITGGTAENRTTLTVTDRKLTVGLHKQSVEGSSLSGGTYEVAPAAGSMFAGDSQEPIVVTEADMAQKLTGRLKAEASYVLTEKTAPQGYKLAAPVTFTVSPKGEVEITAGQAEAENAGTEGYSFLLLKDEAVKVAIRKTDLDGNRLAGSEFAITPEPGSAFAKLFAEELRPEKLVVTDQNADRMKARLIAGDTYAVSETKEPEGYIRLAQSIKFTVQQDGTIVLTENPKQAAALDSTGMILTIQNQETRIYLDKLSNEPAEDGTIRRVSGAKLQIQKNDGAPVTGMEWVSDGSNPGAMTGLPAGRYQLAEVETPYGYCTAEPVSFELRYDNRVVLAGEDTPLPVDENGISTISMTDEVVRAQAVLQKRAEGETSDLLGGVTFDCYRQTGETPKPSEDERLAENLITEADGTIRMENLGQGSYYFLETQSTDLTWLDGEHNIWAFAVAPADHGKTVEITAENKRFQAEASVCKKDGETESPIAGTEFTLRRQNGENWNTLSTAVTDDRGEVSFTLDSKGIYQITETKAAPGYQLDAAQPWMQQFTADDSSYQEKFRWEAENERIGGTLALQKTDASTQHPLDGVEFTVYQKQPDERWQETGRFATGHCYRRDETGTFRETAAEVGTLRLENMSWGTYYIQETQAQEGYVPSQQKFQFTIDQRNLDIQLHGDQGGSITNAQTRIWFYKYGKYAEECADAVWGDIPDGSSRIPLAGSEFTAYRDAACTDAVMRAESQEDGLVEFYKLSCGETYYIRETKASEGYLLNETVYQAELDEAGAYQGITLEGEEIPDMTVVNDVQRVDISLKKVSEQDPELILPGSTYGLFKKTSDIPKVSARAFRRSGTSTGEAADPEWSLIAKSVTDEAGRIVFRGVLMDKDYMVRELEAPDGSQVSQQPVTIRFGVNEQGKVVVKEYHDGSGTAQVDPDTGEIVWLEPPIMVGFAKKDAQGRLIAGAKLAVQDMEGNILVRFTSSGTEPYVIYGDKLEGKLLAGHSYQLVEETAPSGYLKAEPVMFTAEAKLTGPNETFIQPVEMTDAFLTFTVEKRANDTQKFLPDAALEICKAAEGKVAQTCRKERLSWKTGDAARIVEGLAPGEYILRETAAPNGYELAEEIPFTLTEEGKVLMEGREAAGGRIVMTDARTKTVQGQPDTGAASQGGQRAQSVKTGDGMHSSGYLLTLLFAAVLAAESSRKRTLRKAKK